MPENTIQEKLKALFCRIPEKIAIEYGNTGITYHELNSKSDCIANWIISNGFKKESFIGVLLDNKIDFISTVIGILKAGCIFVPFDSSYPAERLNTFFRTIEIKFILTDVTNNEKFSEIFKNKSDRIETVIIDNLLLTNIKDISIPKIEYSPDDKIYIYFTSGSTGNPKAIIGKNASLLHFVNWEIETFGIDDLFRISQFASVGFDASLRDIFVPLCSGGTVCIPIEMKALLEPEKMANWIEKSEITLIHCTPSLFKLFISDALSQDKFMNLKYVLMAGERILPKDIEPWYKKISDRVQLVNMYGATETTMVKTFYLIQQSDVEKISIPIGKPIKGAKIIIVDDNMNMLPQGAIGEIIIRTPYRTFGYYNSQFNKKSFIQNPFSDNPDDIVYRTGDLGKLLPDGNLEFYGRIDRQVKIRGVRVELSEIENTILTFDGIKGAVVTVKEYAGNNECLCAYIIVQKDVFKGDSIFNKFNISGLREFLSVKFPEYMIPQYFIIMDRFPVTQNGKIDYKALPDPNDCNKGGYIAPRNSIEKELGEIWCELLNIERVGVNDNFLQIGGHSLNVMSMVSRVNQRFEVELPLSVIFDNATLEAISNYIQNSTEYKYAEIKSAEDKQYYIASQAQKRIFAQSKIKEAETAYNMPMAILIEAQIDKMHVEEVITALIRRHESLRTSFELIECDLIQRIQKEVSIQINHFKLTETQALNQKDLDNKIKRTIKEFIQPFDLSKAPLMRVCLIELSSEKFILVFDMHHIISDAISISILSKEFVKLYNGKELPALKLQYKDFSEWQNEYLKMPIIKDYERYYLDLFKDGIPVLNMPTDFPRPKIRSFRGDKISFNAGAALSESINSIAVQSGATLYMVLLAALNVLLMKCSGQNDIIIGSPVSGRHHNGLENTVGVFINTLVIRNFPKPQKTFAEFLNELKVNFVKSLEYQDYQLDDLINKLKIPKSLERNSLFDIVFVAQNIDAPVADIGGTKILPYAIEENTSKFDLTLQMVEIEKDIVFSIEYSTDIFLKETVYRIADDYLRILKAIVVNVDITIGDISLETKYAIRKNILSEDFEFKF